MDKYRREIDEQERRRERARYEEEMNRRRKEEKRKQKQLQANQKNMLYQTIDPHRLSLLHKLGLTSDQDNPLAIRSAYRQMALKYHPDKNSSAEAPAKFREILKVYEELINSQNDG